MSSEGWRDSDVAIRVASLSKRYRLGEREPYKALRDLLARSLSAPARALGSLVRGRRPSEATVDPSRDILWALKDVSFEIQRGEVVGIIGRNGAGKTTLLKVLSRVTLPTHGVAHVWGRVGSLLEVGTGFHPELTGWENIYLNGAILGMTRREIKRKFDEIVAFAELEKFLDTPVKRYSSGMFMRLAFSVAAHLESEILLVDEVLAVGDAVFQRKCLGKMGEVAQQGRTVLFVSHNLAAVERLCQRGIVLDGGKITYIGSQVGAVTCYQSSLEVDTSSLHLRKDRRGTGDLRVIQIEFRDSSGARLGALRAGQDVDVYLRYTTASGFQGSDVVASIVVTTHMNVPVFLQHNRLAGTRWDAIPTGGAFVCRLRRLPLPPALYRLGFSVIRHGEYLDAVSDAVEMDVTEGDFFGSGEVPPMTHGVCLVDAEWRVEDGAR